MFQASLIWTRRRFWKKRGTPSLRSGSTIAFHLLLALFFSVSFLLWLPSLALGGKGFPSPPPPAKKSPPESTSQKAPKAPEVLKKRVKSPKEKAPSPPAPVKPTPKKPFVKIESLQVRGVQGKKSKGPWLVAPGDEIVVRVRSSSPIYKVFLGKMELSANSRMIAQETYEVTASITEEVSPGRLALIVKLQAGPEDGRELTVVGPLTITKVDPLKGSIFGGTEVTIEGSGFSDSTVVLIGEEEEKVIPNYVGETMIIVRTPSRGEGPHDIVLARNKESKKWSEPFTYFIPSYLMPWALFLYGLVLSFLALGLPGIVAVVGSRRAIKAGRSKKEVQEEFRPDQAIRELKNEIKEFSGLEPKILRSLPEEELVDHVLNRREEEFKRALRDIPHLREEHLPRILNSDRVLEHIEEQESKVDLQKYREDITNQWSQANWEAFFTSAKSWIYILGPLFFAILFIVGSFFGIQIPITMMSWLVIGAVSPLAAAWRLSERWPLPGTKDYRDYYQYLVSKAKEIGDYAFGSAGPRSHPTYAEFSLGLQDTGHGILGGGA